MQRESQHSGGANPDEPIIGYWEEDDQPDPSLYTIPELAYSPEELESMQDGGQAVADTEPQTPKKKGWFPFGKKKKEEAPPVPEKQQSIEEMFQEGYPEDYKDAVERSEGDSEKFQRILREKAFLIRTRELADMSDQQLCEMNPYVETGEDRKNKFKQSTKRRLAIKILVSVGIVAVGAGVAAATAASAGSLLPVVAGLAAKAFGLGAVASFGAGTLVDAKHYLWSGDDPHKKELAQIFENRNLEIRQHCRRILLVSQRGYIQENGNIINLQRAKTDLFEYVSKLEDPNDEKNHRIAELKNKIIASEKGWRRKRFLATFLTGLVTSAGTVLLSLKELAHSVEFHGFDMHGEGLGGIVSHIKEIDHDFTDQTTHFAKRFAEGANDHTSSSVNFNIDDRTHDLVHKAVENHPESWSGYHDFQADVPGHDGYWHNMASTDAFTQQASEHANLLAAEASAGLAMAFLIDGIADGISTMSMEGQIADAKKMEEAEKNLGISSNLIGENIASEATEKKRLGEELLLTQDQIEVGAKTNEQGEEVPGVVYTAYKDNPPAGNKFILNDFQEGLYYITPCNKDFDTVGPDFPLNEQDFNKWFVFKSDSVSPQGVEQSSGYITEDEEQEEEAFGEDLSEEVKQDKKLVDDLNEKYKDKIININPDNNGNFTLSDPILGSRKVRAFISQNVFDNDGDYKVLMIESYEGDLAARLEPQKLPEDQYKFVGWLGGVNVTQNMDKFDKSAPELKKEGKKVFVRFTDGTVWEYQEKKTADGKSSYRFSRTKDDGATEEKPFSSNRVRMSGVDWYTDVASEIDSKNEQSNQADNEPSIAPNVQIEEEQVDPKNVLNQALFGQEVTVKRDVTPSEIIAQLPEKLGGEIKLLLRPMDSNMPFVDFQAVVSGEVEQQLGEENIFYVPVELAPAKIEGYEFGGNFRTEIGTQHEMNNKFFGNLGVHKVKLRDRELKYWSIADKVGDGFVLEDDAGNKNTIDRKTLTQKMVDWYSSVGNVNDEEKKGSLDGDQDEGDGVIINPEEKDLRKQIDPYVAVLANKPPTKITIDMNTDLNRITTVFHDSDFLKSIQQITEDLRLPVELAGTDHLSVKDSAMITIQAEYDIKNVDTVGNIVVLHATIVKPESPSDSTKSKNEGKPESTEQKATEEEIQMIKDIVVQLKEQGEFEINIEEKEGHRNLSCPDNISELVSQISKMEVLGTDPPGRWRPRFYGIKEIPVGSSVFVRFSDKFELSQRNVVVLNLEIVEEPKSNNEEQLAGIEEKPDGVEQPKASKEFIDKGVLDGINIGDFTEFIKDKPQRERTRLQYDGQLCKVTLREGHKPLYIIERPGKVNDKLTKLEIINKRLHWLVEEEKETAISLEFKFDDGEKFVLKPGDMIEINGHEITVVNIKRESDDKLSVIYKSIGGTKASKPEPMDVWEQRFKLYHEKYALKKLN